ncbi:DUF6158 family protein [Streptomyces sp. NBC_00335]|uniref:DUF6158 family protein n=1 Tax=unclassified Streptomyces TaxID=2593676 RepID=UPI002253FEDF|nr:MULTISPECIES: DUF6158 family protein [unclassified Streptomyces]MCX5402740.1 DUF6158 family protein [Streptomyces sp. NBC_00086]
MAEREAREAGPSAGGLEEGRLMKELEAIHRTRHETLLHGSEDALVTHTRRMAELEREYVRRHPERAQTTGRTRSGARARTGTEEQG